MQEHKKKEKTMKSNEFYVLFYKHPADIAYIFQLTHNLCGSKRKANNYVYELLSTSSTNTSLFYMYIGL